MKNEISLLPVSPASRFRIYVLIVAAIMAHALQAQGRSSLRASIDLRCEGQSAPLAVPSSHPHLTWKLQSAEGARGVRQSYFRLIVATTRQQILSRHGNIWDSGRQEQAESNATIAATLLPATIYWWAIQVWDQRGLASPWSVPTSFMTAPSSWTASWIAAPFSTEQDGSFLDGSHPMPVFRRVLVLHEQPIEAFLYITGLGQYEGYLNRKRIGSIALAQAWTDYRKTVTYDTYDITSQLHSGTNTFAVLLGNGMYNVQHTKGRYTKFEGSFGAPKLTAEIYLRYADGHTERILTDSQWRTARGPILFSSTYGGEDFDATRIPIDWYTASRNAADPALWLPAQIVTGPGGRMVPAIAPPVIEHKHYLAHLTALKLPHTQVFDIGQNIAGWPRIKLHGPAGATLRIIPGELLKPDGSVSQASSGGPQWWSYTLRGSGEEIWQPHFSYYGFRYLQLKWTKATGAIDTVEGISIHSASPPAGTFVSSSNMLNRIHALILAAMHNNEVSLFTDCPHREKLGWLEQTHLVASALLYNDDLSALYRATMQNIADAQTASGEVPTIAPQYTHFAPKYAVYDDSPEWGSAAILAPWHVYQMTGDIPQLQQNYATMQRYLQYLQSRAINGIVAYGLGDWYDIGPKPPGFSQDTTLGVTATLMLYEDAASMQKIATLLGKPEDAARYHQLATAEASAFQHRFFHADKGYYDTGSQTANAMPLALGIVPPDQQSAVLNQIVEDIHHHTDHVTTGEVGFPYLIHALLQHGQSDLLLAMLLRKDPPSYRSQLEAGATSLTEAWDANPHNSQDHFMLGAGDEWFYRGLAGIDIDFSRQIPAERLTIAPTILPGITFAKATYNSTWGLIASSWHTKGATLSLDLTIPTGAEATLHLPAAPNSAITESGVSASYAAGVKAMPPESKNIAIFHLGSGRYHFRSRLPQGFDRATAIPRTSSGYLPDTAQ